jgi:capsular exopolysaccharide synthesis family protein
VIAAELASGYARAYVAERKAAVSKQYQPVIDQLTQTKNALQAQVVAPGTTVDVIRTIRPQITLDVRTLAALSNYLEQESRGVSIQPNTGAPSVTKSSPVKYAILGALAGLILGLIAAFIRNALDRRVRSNDQMTASLELTVLASVPTPSRKLRQANQLVMLNGEALSGEAFRMLAARLEVICGARNRKVIMVTSALPKEGKSTSASNLALALAQLGHPVTLVDADLVRPTAAGFFGLGERAGLTEVLSGEAELSDVAVEVSLPADMPGTLTVVPPGRRIAEPVGLLASDLLTATLKSLAGSSHYVIVDSPPLLSISHGMVIGTRVDAILAVARADQLVTEVADDLKEALDALPTPKLGIVVTAADSTGGYGSGYGYYAPPAPGKSVRKTAGGVVPTHSIAVPRTQAD